MAEAPWAYKTESGSVIILDIHSPEKQNELLKAFPPVRFFQRGEMIKSHGDTVLKGSDIMTTPEQKMQKIADDRYKGDHGAACIDADYQAAYGEYETQKAQHVRAANGNADFSQTANKPKGTSKPAKEEDEETKTLKEYATSSQTEAEYNLHAEELKRRGITPPPFSKPSRGNW